MRFFPGAYAPGYILSPRGGLRIRLRAAAPWGLVL